MTKLNDSDRQQISEIYATYARAIDEKRYDLLSQVFLDDATLCYEVGPHEFSCLGHESANYFGDFLKFCYWTNHLIANPMIESTSQVFATARVIATHLQRQKTGAMSRWILRGSYHDTMVNTDFGWRISKRLCLCPDSEGEFLTSGIEEFSEVAWTEPARIRPAD
ncbi:MAG: nuclear transport factor 2 family protein [Pseudomonadota bacterium]